MKTLLTRHALAGKGTEWGTTQGKEILTRLPFTDATFLLRSLLPVMNHLSHTTSRVLHISKAKDANLTQEETFQLISDVRSAEDQLRRTFHEFGAMQFGAIGDKFEPAKHVAVKYEGPIPHPHHVHVVNVIKPGWMYHGHTLQEAHVDVDAFPKDVYLARHLRDERDEADEIEGEKTK